MVTYFMVLVSVASVSLSRQADVPLEGQATEKNVGLASENITSTAPTNFGVLEDHTFIPFRQKNGSYPGSVTKDPTPINATQTPLFTLKPTKQPVSGEYPILDGIPVPSPDEQSGEEVPFQWHVGIYSKTFSPYKQICGGTLVSLKAVISAAHCFWSDLEGALSPTQFVVATGKRYRPLSDPKDELMQKSEVAAVHIPSRFRGSSTSFQGDIAVVLLSSSFAVTQLVRPACVSLDEEFDKQQLQKGNNGTVLGWGLTEEDGGPSPILNYVELPFVDIDECLSTAAEDFLKYITADKICAGVTTGKALCRGDSGGGWIVYDESKPPVPYLRGVASTAARNDHQCNAYALAALTHVLSHRTFLTQHIPGLEDECRLHYPQRRKENDKLAVRMGGNSKLMQHKGKKKFVCNCHCNNKKT